jgi:hypothetical protein
MNKEKGSETLIEQNTVRYKTNEVMCVNTGSDAK